MKLQWQIVLVFKTHLTKWFIKNQDCLLEIYPHVIVDDGFECKMTNFLYMIGAWKLISL
jgi:hypothetical protein